jgi:hypothetical protein
MLALLTGKVTLHTHQPARMADESNVYHNGLRYSHVVACCACIGQIMELMFAAVRQHTQRHTSACVSC